MLADTKTPWQTYASAWLNAQAQVVFLSTPLQGFLFLLALSLFSPWGAAGMVLGALMAIKAPSTIPAAPQGENKDRASRNKKPCKGVLRNTTCACAFSQALA